MTFITISSAWKLFHLVEFNFGSFSFFKIHITLKKVPILIMRPSTFSALLLVEFMRKDISFVYKSSFDCNFTY